MLLAHEPYFECQDSKKVTFKEIQRIYHRQIIVSKVRGMCPVGHARGAWEGGSTASFIFMLTSKSFHFCLCLANVTYLSDKTCIRQTKSYLYI